MKLIKTELRTLLGDFSSKLPDAVSEANTILNALQEIEPFCYTEKEYMDKGGEDCDYAFDQLDAIENLLSAPDPIALTILAENHCPSDFVLTRRLKNALEYLDATVKLVRDYTTAYVPLSEKEIDILRDRVHKTLGHLSTFIYYQFNLKDTKNDLVNAIAPTVDINIVQYVGEDELDIYNYINRIESIKNSFRPNLPIFEEHPEYEDVFYDIAGPYVQDFDDLEESLELNDIVKVVCDDSLDLESYIKEIESRNGTGEKESSKLKELSSF